MDLPSYLPTYLHNNHHLYSTVLSRLRCAHRVKQLGNISIVTITLSSVLIMASFDSIPLARSE